MTKQENKEKLLTSLGERKRNCEQTIKNSKEHYDIQFAKEQEELDIVDLQIEALSKLK